MPILLKTPSGTVLEISGAALIRGADGKMKVLEVGDVVKQGDVILTTQDGIVHVADAPEAPLEFEAPAAGLGAGDGGSLGSALRVDRISESLEAAAAFVQGTSPERSAPTFIDGAIAGRSTGETPATLPPNQPPTATPSAASGMEDARLPLPIGGRDDDGTITAVTIVSAPAGGVLTRPDGSIVVVGQTLSPDDAAGLQFTPPPDFNGDMTIGYTVTDDGGATSAPATTTIVVLAVNDMPIAAADVVVTPEDTPVAIDVLANDHDIDGDTLVVTHVAGMPISVGNPVALPEGSVALFTDGTLIFTPRADFNGPVSFGYTAADPSGATASATVSVQVTPVNDAPTLIGDPPIGQPVTILTPEDTAVVIDVLANDFDTDGDAITITRVEGQPISSGSSVAVANGSVRLNSDGTLTFTPAQDFNGPVTFTYGASDGQAESNAPVSLIVLPVNDAPAPAADALVTDEDTALVIAPAALLANDRDVDGDALSITGVDGAVGGSVALVDGNVVFTPAPDFNGAASFSYTVSDGNGASASASVAVTVRPLNDAPIAAPDAATTAEDTAVAIDVLDNDSDIDGGTLVVTSAVAANGSIVIGANGTVAYTPNADFNGIDTISYSISDGHGGVASSTVTVNVTPLNEAPLAQPDAASTSEDTPVSIAVLTNDTDIDGDLLVVTSASAGNGSVAIAPDGTLLYTPNANFNGIDTISYAISDGNGGISSLTVAVTVNPLNDPPSAGHLVANTPEDQAITVAPLATTGDIDGDALTIVAIAGQPVAPGDSVLLPQGSVMLNADGTVTFTPRADYNGPASFGYTVSDGAATANGSIAITVTPVNDAPLALDDAASTNEDTPVTFGVLGNDSDIDGDVLAVTGASALNGAVVVNPDGTLTYTPNPDFFGTDTVTYSISDGNGGTDTAQVSVSVNPVNDPPLALPDAATTPEDTPLVIGAGSLLANDSDPEGNPLVVSSVGNPAGGTVSMSAGLITFTPAANYSGPATFDYTIADGNGGFSTATVTINVTPVNDAPVAQNDSASTNEDTPVVVNVLGNDSDIDGDPLSVSSASALHGSVTINPDNTLTYTPEANYFGSDTISYSITDGNGGTASASVAVTVNPVNDAPIARNDSATTPEDTQLVISAATLLANDSDVDGGALTVTSVQDALNGSVTLVGGNVLFTPSANYHGPASFTYSIGDGHGRTATASVSVNVTSINDAPVVGGASVTTSEEGLVSANADASGTSDTTNARSASGVLALGDADADALTVTLSAPVVALSSGGQPIIWTGSGTQTLVGSVGAAAIVTATIDNSGAYTVALDGPIDHAAAGVEDLVSFGIGVHVSDGASVVASTLTVNVEDDSALFGTAPQAGVIANAAGAMLTGALNLSIGADDGAPAKAAFSVTSVDTDGFIRATHTGADGAAKTQHLTYDGMKLQYQTDPATGALVAKATDGTAVFTIASAPPGPQYQVTFHHEVDATSFTSVAFSALRAGNTPGTYLLSDVQGVFTINVTGTSNGQPSTVNTNQSYIGVGNQFINQSDADLLTFDFGGQPMHGIGLKLGSLGTGETMIYKAYDDAGTLVGQGTVAGNAGSADTLVNLLASDFDGGTFSKMTFEAGTGSGYRLGLTMLSGETGVISQHITLGVTATDADGDSTMAQTFNLSIESDATLVASASGAAVGGSSANETLIGSSGADVLSGGGGNDALTGGAGSDVFAWKLADRGAPGTPAVDAIGDFDNAAGGDVLDLRDLLQAESAGELTNYLHFDSAGGSTTVSISSSGGFAGGFSPAAADQVISVAGVDLVAGFSNDSQVIADLLSRGKLLVDAGA